MYRWPWQETLFALYGLEELVRVDVLERKQERHDLALLFNHAQQGRALTDDIQALRAELQRSDASPRGGMPRSELLTFPGMPNHSNGQVS